MNSMVTIIVPVYNAEKYLCKCVDSLLSQTLKHVEIILVDDGSTDSSVQICDKYASVDMRVKVLHQQNQGVSVARNNGIKLATGEYIGFVDADDYVEVDMYEKMLESIEKNNADIVICTFIGSEQPVFEKKYRTQKDYLVALLKDEFGMGGYPCNKLYKRSLLDFYQPFPMNIYLAEDFVFNVSLVVRQKELSAIYCGLPLYHYCQHENSATGEFHVKQLTWLKAVEKIDNLVRGEMIAPYLVDKLYCHASSVMLSHCAHRSDLEEECKILKKHYRKHICWRYFLDGTENWRWKLYGLVGMMPRCFCNCLYSVRQMVRGIKRK